MRAGSVPGHSSGELNGCLARLIPHGAAQLPRRHMDSGGRMFVDEHKSLFATRSFQQLARSPRLLLGEGMPMATALRTAP